MSKPPLQNISPAVIGELVNEALSTLEDVKRQIIKMRFGLSSSKGIPMSYSEIAVYLTKNLSAEIKFQIINKQQNKQCDEIILTVAEVKNLEAQALRELARCKRN